MPARLHGIFLAFFTIMELLYRDETRVSLEFCGMALVVIIFPGWSRGASRGMKQARLQVAKEVDRCEKVDMMSGL